MIDHGPAVSPVEEDRVAIAGGHGPSRSWHYPIMDHHRCGSKNNPECPGFLVRIKDVRIEYDKYGSHLVNKQDAKPT
jgi:hypothetical protein